MPSVKDMLGRENPARNESALEEGIDLVKGIGANSKQGSAPDRLDSELMAKMLESADQRVGIMQQRVDDLQFRVDQIETQIRDSQSEPVDGLKSSVRDKLKGAPTNSLKGESVNDLAARLEGVKESLELAKSDLIRANEAKLNTELTSSLRQEHHEPSVHVDHTTHNSQGVGSGGGGTPKVGAVYGRTSAAPLKVGGKGHGARH